ncbi:MAG: carbon starvation protein A [candidate division Zixibacteria bacterium]|nr:carbon starvation protein A [candidate division Zixibacteria bacterium]
MSLLLYALISGLILLCGYIFYGKFLEKKLNLNDNNPVPSKTLYDGVDYIPTRRAILLGQHFSAISAAGPIVGPILAGLLFGWLPALLWILVGSIFVGGVHDFTSLVASVRHKAKSIAEVVKEHMSHRTYLLFLLFIWFSLVYVIVAFTDITASAFIQETYGAGVASSSFLYLSLAILMGLSLYKLKFPLWLSTIIFLPMVVLAIWYGQKIPLSLPSILGLEPVKIWDLILLCYCFIASIIPIWLLLQPRGYLGGLFLYGTLLTGIIGILFGGFNINYPSFITWNSSQGPLFPILFITVACGACSGFHAIVSSGTSSKQLSREKDAKLIGYGGMLLEALVAIIALATLMILTRDGALSRAKPDQIYASGISRFLSIFKINPDLAMSFGLLAFATFIYDTLDVCTRLGRYVFQELTSWKGKISKVGPTLFTLLIPAFAVMIRVKNPSGEPLPAWRIFWSLFGSSNQLLAALTLLGVTVWLKETKKSWIYTLLPMAFMLIITIWSLVQMALPWLEMILSGSFKFQVVPLGSIVLLALALLLLIEAMKSLFFKKPELRVNI